MANLLHRVWQIKGILFLACISIPGQSAAQDAIRIETNLITVPVTVQDRLGRYVLDLEKNQFAVYESGFEQRIEYFQPVDTPITVLLLLDCSGSMTRHLGSMGIAVEAFIRRLRSEDHIIVQTFADDVDEIVSDIQVNSIHEDIKIREKSSNNTYVYDAVDAGLKRLAAIRGRKAMVLFTDALSKNRKATAQKNLHAAEEQDAVIYTIRFGEIMTQRPNWRPGSSANDTWHPTFDPENNGRIITQRDLNMLGNGSLTKQQIAAETARIAGYMMGLAAKTGGRSFHIKEISDLEKTFGDVSAELRRQYTLGYYANRPGKEGEIRKIVVRINIPEVTIRARGEVTYGVRRK
jgi:Ca-activated chloride channel homolog